MLTKLQAALLPARVAANRDSIRCGDGATAVSRPTRPQDDIRVPPSTITSRTPSIWASSALPPFVRRHGCLLALIAPERSAF